MMIISVASVLGPALGATIYGIDRDALWIGCLIVGGGVFVGFQLLALRSQVDVCEAPT